MADVHSKKTRSYNMSRIRSKDTNPELIVRKFLYKNGFRYRLNKESLPGKPDIVLRKYNTCIFVHGCFWHGHQGCKYFKIPKTRSEWWRNKILATKQRDVASIAKLKETGWNILIIWECELQKKSKELTLDNLLKFLGDKNANTSN